MKTSGQQSLLSVDRMKGRPGHAALPMKWVGTIENIHEQRKPDQLTLNQSLNKSRLVRCGILEGATGVRTDAPTSDFETRSIVAAFAVSKGMQCRSRIRIFRCLLLNA